MATLGYTQEQAFIRATDALNTTITVPSENGLHILVWVHAMRSSTTNVDFVFDEVSIGGAAMTLMHAEQHDSTNRYYRTSLYRMDDPFDGAGGQIGLSIGTSRGVAAIAATVFHVYGVTEFGTPVGVNSDDDDHDPEVSLSLSIDVDLSPSLVLAGGNVRYRTADNWDLLTATGDVTQVAAYRTGDNSTTDLVVFAGEIDDPALGTYSVGWSWDDEENAAIVAVSIYGTAETANIDLSGVDPTVLFGDATLDDLIGEMTMTGVDPTIIVGSIPPVQVLHNGNPYLTTSARTLAVILLATDGNYWVVGDGSNNVEELGLTVIRRKGYLTLR